MEVKNHPEIYAHYVNETVQHFLQARGIVNHLCPAIDHSGGWYRFAILNQTTPRKESNWVEIGFHGFPLECLASIIQNGLLESSPDRSGCRFSQGPGIYLTNKRTHSAQSYSRFVANCAMVFFRFTMECLVDRNQRKSVRCKKKNEWVQPAGSCTAVALWVQAASYDDIESGECIMPMWIPLLEVPAQAQVHACQNSDELNRNSVHVHPCSPIMCDASSLSLEQFQRHFLLRGKQTLTNGTTLPGKPRGPGYTKPESKLHLRHLLSTFEAPIRPLRYL